MVKKNKNKRFFKSGKKASVGMEGANKKKARARPARNMRIVKNTKSKSTMRKHHNAAAKPEIRPAHTAKNSDKQVKRGEGKARKYIPSPKETGEALNILFTNSFAADYLKKNVSKNALDVLALLQSPNTDEAIALQLDMKVNSVRRILNIMQGYGITNYYVSKNTNGWLSFAWYININKMSSFFDYIKSMRGDEYSVIKEDCNDYFICKKCYNEDNIIFTFDAAYEAGFKCASCGGKFDMVGKEEAVELINTDKQKQENVLVNFKVDAGKPSVEPVLPHAQQKRHV